MLKLDFCVVTLPVTRTLLSRKYGGFNFFSILNRVIVLKKIGNEVLVRGKTPFCPRRECTINGSRVSSSEKLLCVSWQGVR